MVGVCDKYHRGATAGSLRLTWRGVESGHSRKQAGGEALGSCARYRVDRNGDLSSWILPLAQEILEPPKSTPSLRRWIPLIAAVSDFSKAPASNIKTR